MKATRLARRASLTVGSLILIGACGPRSLNPRAAKQADWAEKCTVGDREACESLADVWMSRDYVPAWAKDEARRDLEAGKAGCTAGTIGAACIVAGRIVDAVAASEHSAERPGDEWYRKAAELGELTGQDYFRNADGKAAAKVRAEQECEKGSAWACFRLAQRIQSAEYGFPEDKPRAQVLSLKACRGGSATGCWLAGLLAPEREEKLGLLWKACTAGSGGGCSALGVVEEDKTQAHFWDERGCTLGTADGCSKAAPLVVAPQPA